MMFYDILLVITGTLTGLLAGLFFGYAVSVNGGLHRLKDHEYVAAMKSINTVIQNPPFFLSFFGPVVLLPLVTILSWSIDSPRSILLLAASGLYVIGTFGLTLVGNIPLNHKLARFNLDTATPDAISQARAEFEGPWNRWHLIRTIASAAATAAIFAACLSD